MRNKLTKLIEHVKEAHEAHHARHPRGERATGRLRHGQVRAAILLSLEEGPAHGYEIGHRLERASGGSWRPSPGSIYPTLQLLADEELVTCEERDGKSVYTLTAAGRAELAERTKRGEGAPWVAAYDGDVGEMRAAMMHLKMAARQVAVVGTTEQRARAVAIMVEARRQIYDLLAKE